MSYSLLAFAVDLPEIERRIGSGDQGVIDAVIANNPEEFDEEEEDEDDDLSLKSAVRQLVMGESMDPEEAHQYGYALQELCSTYGEDLPCDLWCGVRWGAIEGCGLEPLMTRTGSPVALPPNDDFPTIAFLRRGEETAKALADAKRRLEGAPPEGLDENLDDLIEEYAGWLETATEKDRDLIFFYY